MILFIFVGIINTLFSYSLYAFFIFIGLNYIFATLFATILGVLFNFQTIGRVVFKKYNSKLIYKFVLVYTILFFINILIIKIFKSFGFNDYISGLFAIIINAGISFILNKYFVFSKEIK